MPVLGFRVAAALLVGALALTGCVEDDPNINRAPGDAITAEEAEILADLLYRDSEQGGADVTITAPYDEEALLTLTGSIDFTTGEGTLDANTTYTSGQPDEARTVYFTRDRILVGNLPDFTAAMAAAGRPDAQYLRIDLDAGVRLIDNIVGMLQRLATDAPDDPDNLIAAGYTWQGAGRIDNVLISTFSPGTSASTISVGVEDKLLHQFVAPAPGADFPVTITLSDHGERAIELPPEEQVADASAYPEVAAQFGF